MMKTAFLGRTLSTLLLGFSSTLSLAATYSPPEGIFVSSSPTTADGGHSIHKDDTSRSYVKGVLVRVMWEDLEKRPGVYDFSLLDEELQRAEDYDTQVVLAVVNGPHAPSWLKSKGVVFADFIDAKDNQQKSLPLLWDQKYISYWTNFIAALGARYNSHPRIKMVHITNSTNNGFEMQLPEHSEIIVPWEDLGYNEDTAIEAWKPVIDAFGNAFPDMPLDLEVHPVLRSDRLAQEVARYASETLGEQIGLFGAWWSQKNSESYAGMYDLLRYAAATTWGAAQLVCAETDEPDCTGSGGMNEAIGLALRSGIRYIEVWNQDVRNPAFEALWKQTADTIAASNTRPVFSSVNGQSMNEDSAAKTIRFSVSDQESGSTALSLSVTSDDKALFPAENMRISTNGGQRTVTLTPAEHKSGEAAITLYANDGSQSGARRFAVAVNSVNDLPVLGSIADQTINEGQSTSNLVFSVSDTETAKDDLVLSASSSNTTLVPASAISLTTSGNNRAIKITPADDQSGSAKITVSAFDGTGTASTSFTLTVNNVNDAPTISTLQKLTMNEDASGASQSFTINDIDNAVDQLLITATSNSSQLIPASNISFSGTGSTRTITVKPAADRNGSATVNVSVSDGSSTTKQGFDVVVNAVNDAPTIATVSDITVDEDSNTKSLNFQISDAETASSALTVSVRSSNTTLFPSSSLSLSGTDSTRKLSFKPAADQNGSATLTLTVSDGSLTTQTTFKVNVTAINDAPRIDNLKDVTLSKSGNGTTLAFSVTDPESSSTAMTVTAAAGNSRLLPESNLSLSGSGSNRSLSIRPSGNTGSTSVTITASDGKASSSTRIEVTVQ